MINLRSHLVRDTVGSYEDILDLTRSLQSVFVECYGGGGGKGGGTRTIEVPATPPPAPPAEEPMMEEFTDEDEEKRTRKAMTQGAKSLQIPLGASANSNVGTA